MKKIIFLLVFVATAFFFHACAPAYVGVQPNYSQSIRPLSPSNNHVWIDDSWNWNRWNRTYVMRKGYWAAPNRGRIYTQGYWQSNQRGHRWINGRWR